MKHVLVAVSAVLFTASALAGTATMNFDSGIGLLTDQYGTGALVASGGRASFTGPNVSFLEKNGSRVSATGPVSVTITLRPYSDAVNGIGIVLAASGGDTVEAICDSTGLVTLWDSNDIWESGTFSYPGGYDNSFTVEFNEVPGRATLYLNGVEKASLDSALDATSVYVGVESGGTGGFASFTATGTGIPDYPPVDTDNDGVTDDEEEDAGTDPNDPGSRPVSGALGATVTGLNGASVNFPAGSFSGAINASVSTPPSVPSGTVPGGKLASGAALSLGPDSTAFSTPVTVTMPYTDGQIGLVEESTLTAFYHDGVGFSSTGIGNVEVNASSNTVSFTTTHFCIFVLAGDPADSDGDGTPDYEDAFPRNPNGQTDTDDDGIGNEWELDNFGNLTTADETSDYDSDGVTDLKEFTAWYFNLDPTDGLSSLPAASVWGLAAVATLIAALARRRMRTTG